MSKIRKLMAGAIAAMALTAVAGSMVHADDVIKWKLATNIVETTKTGEAFAEFSEKIKEATGGKLEIDNFYGGQLGAEADMMANCQEGSVAIVQMSFSLLAQFNSAYNVMDLPFLFDNKEHFDRFRETDECKALLESFSENGLWVHDIYLMGYRYPNMVKKPITAPEDFEGVIFRVMDNPVQMATLEALGATPITVPYSDVYNALQSGVAEGWSCDCSGYITTSSYEVAKYISTIPLFAVANGIIVSEKAVEELPDDIRDIVKQTIQEEFPKVMDQMWEENIDQLQQCADAGCEVNDVEDTAAFIEKVKPVWDDIAAEYDGVSELLEAIDGVR
ncbi:MAG: TRAP transporter substrate-binding protein [Lachnospiraceae bacterium]|nr:TRAP transporter substrate-binding protein [Lachnospiraceae bacterium]